MKKKIIIVGGDPQSINSEIIYKSWKKISRDVRKRIYLMLEPPNLVSLADKIKANIQVRKNNIIRKKS